MTYTYSSPLQFSWGGSISSRMGESGSTVHTWPVGLSSFYYEWFSNPSWGQKSKVYRNLSVSVGSTNRSTFWSHFTCAALHENNNSQGKWFKMIYWFILYNIILRGPPKLNSCFFFFVLGPGVFWIIVHSGFWLGMENCSFSLQHTADLLA